MNKNYKVEITTERNEKDTYLCITHDGRQWSTVRIRNKDVEIPLIIAELQRHLTQQCSGQETPVIVNHPPVCSKCMRCHHIDEPCR